MQPRLHFACQLIHAACQGDKLLIFAGVVVRVHLLPEYTRGIGPDGWVQVPFGTSQLADRSGVVDERKVRIQRESRHTPPPSLPAKVTFAGFDFSQWMPVRAEQQTGNTIKGLGASPGRVTATARVLRGPEDFGQMKQGDVLVAAITTPAWTPLFALAAAVVTDVGGPLSHSSIVAREYGVPAVLGTGVATHRIHSGDVITVDGSGGVVTLPSKQ